MSLDRWQHLAENEGGFLASVERRIPLNLAELWLINRSVVGPGNWMKVERMLLFCHTV